MEVKTISYEKLVNLGNYQNEKYSATIALQPEEGVAEAYGTARALVEKAIADRIEDDEKRRRVEAEERKAAKREWAEKVMAAPAAFDSWDVREAAQLLGVPNPYDAVGSLAKEDTPF